MFMDEEVMPSEEMVEPVSDEPEAPAEGEPAPEAPVEA